MSYKHKVFLAKQFRRKPTYSERIMWHQLRNRKVMNLKFKRQYITLGYIIDFYCPQLNLAIEIDGKVHQNQKTQDRLRERIIKARNIRFIRLTSDEVENNISQVLEKATKLIIKLENYE